MKSTKDLKNGPKQGQNTATSPRATRVPTYMTSQKTKAHQSPAHKAILSPSKQVSDPASEKGPKIEQSELPGEKAQNLSQTPGKVSGEEKIAERKVSLENKQSSKAVQGKKEAPIRGYMSPKAIPKNQDKGFGGKKACKECEENKEKEAQMQSRIESLEAQLKEQEEKMTQQILMLETENQELEAKIGSYKEVVEANKKVIKEKVTEFADEGAVRSEFTSKINELESQIKNYQKELEQLRTENQNLKFQNMAEVKNIVSSSEMPAEELAQIPLSSKSCSQLMSEEMAEQNNALRSKMMVLEAVCKNKNIEIQNIQEKFNSQTQKNSVIMMQLSQYTRQMKQIGDENKRLRTRMLAKLEEQSFSTRSSDSLIRERERRIKELNQLVSKQEQCQQSCSTKLERIIRISEKQNHTLEQLSIISKQEIKKRPSVGMRT